MTPAINIYISLQPLWLWLAISEITPFILCRNKTTAIFRALNVIIHLVILITVYYIDYQQVKSANEHVYDLQKTQYLPIFNTAGYILALSLYCLEIILIGRQHADDDRNLADQLNDIDAKLIKLGQHRHLLAAHSSIRKLTLKLIIMINVIYIIIGDFACGVIEVRKQLPSDIFFYILISMVIANSKLKFYVFLVLFEERFKIINKIVSTKVIESKQHAVIYPHNGYEFSENLIEIVGLHKKLTRLCQRTYDDQHSLFILINIISIFVGIIGDLYVIMYAVIFRLMISENYRIYIVVLKICLLRCIDMVYIARRSAALCEEV